MLERFFALTKNGTTVGRELIAGLTTFAAMAYILAVNPEILSKAGIDEGALVTATAVSAGVMTVVMAMATNYPIALAPGMGLNAFLAFTICGLMKVPWPAALGLVFYSGLLFFLLSVTGLRRKIVDAFPMELKLSITAGIGFFIAFIGLQNGGLIVANPATLVALGSLSHPAPWLVLAGVLLTGVLLVRKIPGAIVLVVILLTVAGFFLPGAGGTGTLTPKPESIVNWPSSLAPTFFKLDLGWFWKHFWMAFPLVLSLLFVDLFDNMGTLIGVSQRAGLLDKKGDLPKMNRAFMADAGAAMVGSCLGTSTVTSYIESAAGVEAGGRTGLSVIFTGICFLLALFLTPLILIIPAMATAPALIIVGAFMVQGLAELDLKDFIKAVPAFVTMIVMPLTFSISEGIALGMLAYVGLKVGTGKWREISWVGYVLAALFILHLIFRPE